ncbi:MAG: hypothetical protein ACTSWW_10570 [Promethearchaeota archaeon]
MPKIGPYSERDLADKLTKISEQEMLVYYKIRMKRYQKWYVVAILIGVLAVVVFFVLSEQRWFTWVLVVGDLMLLGGVTFSRDRWKRLFENLLYTKRKREKVLKEIQPSRSQGQKYRKNKKSQ